MPRFACQSFYGVIWLLFVSMRVHSAQASDQPLTAHLEWSAPANSGCPEKAAIAEAVEERLSRPVFVESSRADVIVTVALRRAGAKWSAALAMSDRSGQALGSRLVESASVDCADLTEVLPVILALLVDTSRSHVRLSLPRPTNPPNTQPVTPRSQDPSPRPPAPLQGSSWRWGWALLGEGVVGLEPGAAPGASLSGSIESVRVPTTLALWLGALLPMSTSRPMGTRVSLLHGGVQLCPWLWRKGTRGALCTGVAVGSLQARGRGYDVNRNAIRPYWDGRAAAQVDIPISRPWFARFEAGVAVPMTRPRFVGEPEPGVRAVLHQPAAIVPRAAAGIGVGFW